MPRFRILPKTDEWSGRRIDAIALLTLATGLGIRYWVAANSFVNPDEAYHALLATPETFGELYASVLRSPHPPLFLILLHYVHKLMPTDLGIRLIPLVAGALLPWVVYRWISRGWSHLAGLGALAILSLAPELIRLSAEARAYTLELLFMAGALYLMDSAIETSSAWRMAGFALLLYGAVLSDYSAVFFTAAAAVYSLLRFREPHVTAGVKIVWGVSLAGAAGLYALLWMTQIQPSGPFAAAQWSSTGSLRQAFPQPGQNAFLYALRNTAEQFAFLLRLPAAAVAAAILLFLVSLYLLWRKPPEGSMWRGRAIVALMVIPFLAACAASIVYLFPYGRTRHTVFLALFIATGVGIAMEWIARRWIVPLALVAVVATPVWCAMEGRYMKGIGEPSTRKELMEQAIEFLKRSVPPGTVILTESEMRVVLAYYLDTGVRLPEVHRTPSEEITGGWRLFANRWAFTSLEDLRTDLRVLRARYGFGPEVRIWVLDGGFVPLLKPYLEELNRRGELPHLYQFGRAMVAALTPPGFLWEDPRPEDVEQPEPGSTSRPPIPE